MLIVIAQVLKYIADVCYILCSAQSSIERLLDTPKKMAQLIKAKGRKVMNDDLKPEHQSRMLNYATMLVKPNFMMTHIHTINISEFLEVLKQIEEQKAIWQELKNSPLIECCVEEMKSIDTIEIKDYDKVWKNSIEELNSVMIASLYEDEIESKENIQNYIQELKEYATQIQEYYKSMIFKKYFKTFFQRFNLFVLSFFVY